MKKLIIFSFAISISILLFSSCFFSFSESITGNGKVVTKKRDVGTFDAVEVSRGLHVYVTFGEAESVEVEADENLHEVIKTECVNGRLKITSDANIRRAEAKNIRISVPALREIEVSAAATLESNNLLKVEDVEIEVSSAAELDLEVEAKTLKIEISSAAKANLKGRTDDLEADISSAGELKAYDLVSGNCDVNASSAAHASVTAEEKLNAEASSAGSISYKGDAKDIKIEKSSAGSVQKK
jgi:hypothetical protein